MYCMFLMCKEKLEKIYECFACHIKERNNGSWRMKIYGNQEMNQMMSKLVNRTDVVDSNMTHVPW